MESVQMYESTAGGGGGGAKRWIPCIACNPGEGVLAGMKLDVELYALCLLCTERKKMIQKRLGEGESGEIDGAVAEACVAALRRSRRLFALARREVRLATEMMKRVARAEAGGGAAGTMARAQCEHDYDKKMQT